MRRISIQHEDFDLGAEYRRLATLDPRPGAVVTFTGIVRDLASNAAVHALELEHYPGMTERSIDAIVDDAWRRWDLRGVTVIHRIGRLAAGEQIVLVAVASDHRDAAFQAARLLIDYLKTRAVLWKKELGSDGARWVASTASDHAAAAEWAQRSER